MSCMCWETLTVFNCPEEKTKEIVTSIREDSLFSTAFWCDNTTYINGELFFPCNDCTEWGVNDCGDFRKFSRKFPEQTFLIEGETEDNCLYRIYLRNGKKCEYKPTLVWPEFKPEDLE